MELIERSISSIEDTNELHRLFNKVGEFKNRTKKGECEIRNQCDKIQELIINRTDYIVTNKGLVSVS